MTGSFHRHGGRLSEAQARWPDAPLPWLDLSTGINPQPWPGIVSYDRTRLPDPADLAALEAAAARAFGVAPEQVVATPGAEAALRLLPQLIEAHTVAIVSPTYGGHAQAWATRGPVEISLDGLADAETDLAVVVSPNNPDGRVLTAEALDQAAARTVIIDESFADAAPASSMARRAGDRCIVLRSFGKFYGLPGLRLGFLIASPSLAARAREHLGDWPVSAEAIALGRAAYVDRVWAETTRAGLTDDAARLDSMLIEAGFQIAGGCPLFRLARAPDAAQRFERLAAQGVLTRPFSHTPDVLRFGLPPVEGWRRLAQALEASHG